MARKPLHRWVPSYADSFGDLAADVGEQLGMTMDAEQRDILDAIFAEDEPGVPTCFEVGIVAPRQNLKTATLEIAALTDVFVLGERQHVWTAHLFPTARKTWEHMVELIARNEDFRARCVWPPPSSHGEEAIELVTGEKIEFKARSKGGGRGFAGVAKITLDEALFLSGTELGALLPTLATNPAAQVRYGSSAGFANSDALRDIRDRGRAGGDPRLAYVEFGAPRDVACGLEDCDHRRDRQGCALDDEDLWAMANPALGRRIRPSTMRAFRRSMPPHEFMREFLSWWEEPEEAAAADLVVDPEMWKARRDSTSRCLDPVSLGIEVSPTRRASIVAAGWRDDGRWHGEVIATGAGTSWVLDVLLRVVDAVDPAVLVLDSRGPAGSLIPNIQAAGLEPTVTTSTQRAQADQGLADDLAEDRGVVVPGGGLDEAAALTTWRDSGDIRYFDRRNKTADISQMVGLSLARHGLLQVAAQPVKPAPAAPVLGRPVPVGDAPALAGVVDVATVRF